MTGRERVLAAFSEHGTSEVGVVLPYECIFVRDHWERFTRNPWWYQFSPDMDAQVEWRRDYLYNTGCDWICVETSEVRESRESSRIENTNDLVYRVDTRTGTRVQLVRPLVAGQHSPDVSESVRPVSAATTPEQVDTVIRDLEVERLVDFVELGKTDLAHRVDRGFGHTHAKLMHLPSPLWLCYHLWGFEGFMTMVIDEPALVKHACRRYLEYSISQAKIASLLGADVIWIEECFTDMLSPKSFADLNIPIMAALLDSIRTLGMYGVYYFTGNPTGKLHAILETSPDALAFEEGKKGFEVDIESIAAKIKGQAVLLGNLDAIGVLQDGSEDQLKSEVERQLHAGRLNNGRFIMSLGSPVTPSTPIERVKLYSDLVHELGHY